MSDSGAVLAIDKLDNRPSLRKPKAESDPKKDYAATLKEQVQFMDLELKLLKEKVKEAESKANMGDIYQNDEKTSHEHIDQLRVKYAQMRRNFDLQKQDLEKQKIDILGEQFVLNSQLQVLKDEVAKIEADKEEWTSDFDYKIKQVKSKLEDAKGLREAVEKEIAEMKE